MSRLHFGRRGVVLLVGAGIGLSCGGGGSSAGGQFCQQWAAAFCQRLYACTPVDQRGADFAGGASESQCTQGWSATCANPPPAGETFDVNCSGGAHVNTAAKSACLDELSTITCDDFTSPTYTSVCTQVCPVSTATGGSGGSTGGGSGTGGTGGTGGAGGTGGGSGGTGGGSTACGTVEPCGGNPVGTWSFTSECVDLGELALVVQQQFYCADATVTSAQATISGSATFSSDLSYSIVQNISSTVSLVIPISCTSGLSCSDYGIYMSATMGTPLSCSGTTSCMCTQSQATTSSTDTGTYTLSGSNLNITSSAGGAGTIGYCVQGTTIHLITVDGTMHTGPGGQATIVKDTVAQKE